MDNDEKIAALERMKPAELRLAWRNSFGTPAPQAPALRLPASEIEQSIRRAIAGWLRTGANIQGLAASRSANEKKRVFARAERLAAGIENLPVSNAGELLKEIKLRISVNENQINGSFEPTTALGIADDEGEVLIEAKFKIALDQQNYGHEPRLRLQPSEPYRVARDNRLVELLGRAFAARDELLEMGDEAVQLVKTTRLRHLQRLARLSYLDPGIIRSTLNGTQPKSLSARSLWRIGDLPIRFADQAVALGFPNS
jgi:hypothetical protein